MKCTVYDKRGNVIEGISCFMFEGDDAVESYFIPEEAFNQDKKENDENIHHDIWDFFVPVIGENNISLFIDPNSKVFNVISRSDMEDGTHIGTTVSFTDDDYDKFINLMRKVIEYEDIKD